MLGTKFALLLEGLLTDRVLLTAYNRCSGTWPVQAFCSIECHSPVSSAVSTEKFLRTDFEFIYEDLHRPERSKV